jgi:hypothetical protein
MRAVDIGSHGVARNWFGDPTTASLQMTQSEMTNDQGTRACRYFGLRHLIIPSSFVIDQRVFAKIKQRRTHGQIAWQLHHPIQDVVICGY